MPIELSPGPEAALPILSEVLSSKPFGGSILSDLSFNLSGAKPAVASRPIPILRAAPPWDAFASSSATLAGYRYVGFQTGVPVTVDVAIGKNGLRFEALRRDAVIKPFLEALDLFATVAVGVERYALDLISVPAMQSEALRLKNMVTGEVSLLALHPTGQVRMSIEAFDQDIRDRATVAGQVNTLRSD